MMTIHAPPRTRNKVAARRPESGTWCYMYPIVERTTELTDQLADDGYTDITVNGKRI